MSASSRPVGHGARPRAVWQNFPDDTHRQLLSKTGESSRFATAENYWLLACMASICIWTCFSALSSAALGSCLPVRLNSSAALAGPRLHPFQGCPAWQLRAPTVPRRHSLFVVFDNRIVDHRGKRRDFTRGDVARFHILRLVDEFDKFLRRGFVFAPRGTT